MSNKCFDIRWFSSRTWNRCLWLGAEQWSFRKTGTMGTLYQTKRILVSASKQRRRFCGGPGESPPPRKIFFRLYIEKNPAIWCLLWPENGSQCRPWCVLKQRYNGIAVLVRSGSFSTTGNGFPTRRPRNDPWCCNRSTVAFHLHTFSVSSR